MQIKVRGGTPHHGGDNLCYSCRWSRVIRGQTIDEEIVHCDANHMTSIPIRFKVTSCSDYDDSRLPTYGELVQKAWILRPATKRRQAGFVHGRDLQYEEFTEIMSDARNRGL